MHKSRSRWNAGGIDDDGPEGSSWDRKCDKLGIAEAKVQKDALSKSCHTVGGGLSRIKNALSRSVHGANVANSTKPRLPCRPENSLVENSISCVTPKDVVNFAEQQAYSPSIKKNESFDRRAKHSKKNSFKRRKQFDELEDETDDSSDGLSTMHAPPHKTTSLRVLPQNSRPNPPRMCASMNDLGSSARGSQTLSAKPCPPPFGRRDSLPPRYGHKARFCESSREDNTPLPVHLAAEKVANQKINLERRRSSSPAPGRPPRAEVEKKHRHSAPASNFNQTSLTQLEKAFGKEDTLDHYFEMVKASPGKSPSGGPRSVFTHSPGGTMVLPLTSGARSVISPTRSPSSNYSPSRHSPQTALGLPKISSPNSAFRSPSQAVVSANESPKGDSVCAAQLEIPLAVADKGTLSQLQVQYNLYEQMNHSSQNLLDDSFVTRSSDADTIWDLDQILMAKVK